MKVSDLIKFLTDYVDPDAKVLTIMSHYDGDSDCIEDSNPVAYATPSYVVISADDVWYRKHAESFGEYLAVLNTSGSITEQ